MEAKHTPGSWEYQIDDHGRGRIYAGELWIGTTWKATGEGNNSPLAPADANAALIAAAPDLLEHCRTMLSWWEKNSDVLKRFPTLAIDAIRAAILKAEGGAA